MLVRLGFQGTMFLWFCIRRLGDLRLMNYMQRFKTVSNSLIQRLKETNAADILNQVNKVAKKFTVALDFSVVCSREGLYPRGNFSTTTSSKQFFLSLAKYKLFYTS